MALFKEDFKTVKPCQGPEESGVIAGWDAIPNTFPERRRRLVSTAYKTYYFVSRGAYGDITQSDCLATHPLSWTTPIGKDSPTPAPRGAEHLGILQAGFGFRKFLTFGLTSLKAPKKLPKDQFKVVVEGDYVVVPKFDGEGFYDRTVFGGTYHLTDYPLFYHNIRENAIRRIKAFLKKSKST